MGGDSLSTFCGIFTIDVAIDFLNIAPQTPFISRLAVAFPHSVFCRPDHYSLLPSKSDFHFLTVFSTYLVTHWHPQAPAREYRVGATGRRLATRRARVGPTLWLAPALAGVRMARVMMAMLAKSLPVGANIFFSVPSSSVQTHLPWRISDLFG